MALAEIREDAILLEIFVEMIPMLFEKCGFEVDLRARRRKLRSVDFIKFEENRLVEVIVDSDKVAVKIALDSNVRECVSGVEEGVEGSMRQRAASKIARSHVSPRSLFSGSDWPNKDYKESSSPDGVRKRTSIHQDQRRGEIT